MPPVRENTIIEVYRALYELSELAIEVLDAQKKYFKSRATEDLLASKQSEVMLRELATEVQEFLRHAKNPCVQPTEES